MNRLLGSITLLLAGMANPASGQEEARLLRFPHIQGDRIAFVYGGDIWTSTAQGGPARRITSHDEGFELFPRISPDGQWIAFSAEYSGSRQIYLVPFQGGQPRQLTFYPDVGPMPPRGGYDHLPFDWTPDGKKLLIKANRTPYGQRVARYFLVDPWNGGLEEPLQIPEGGPASFSPDGTKLAYNIISREWRTWKRYKAGRAQDIFVYDLQRDTIDQITDFNGTDNFPMWVGNRIYFTSDRTGTLNLYRHDLETKETTQITTFTDFDVLFPSRGRGGVIFECGGWLYVMDTKDETVRRLSINLADDRPWLRPSWKSGSVASYDISPSAKRAVVEYRGEVFDVPAKNGRGRNLTRTPDRREHSVNWSPDGKHISYLAEVGEDYELFVRSTVSGEERQLTNNSGAWILGTSWSPNSEHIAFADKANQLRLVNVESGDVSTLDRSTEGTINSASWSGDSHWLTYTKSSPNGFNSVWVCPIRDGKPTQVTTDHYQDGSPAFDPDGNYLYFVSARDFQFGDMNFDSRLYALLLREDVDSPLAPKEDVEAATEEEEEDEADGGNEQEDGGEEDAGADANAESKDEASDTEEAADEAKDAADSDDDTGDSEEEEDEPLQIDLDGIMDRLVALPGSPGSYFNLEGVPGGFLFVSNGNLQRYDLEGREAKTVLEGVSGYMTTPDGKKLLYRYRGNLAISGATPGQKAGASPVRVDEVEVRIDPRVEWAQIYMDAWRIMRDWFYDTEMHGVDWRGMREKYEPLVPHVAHRDDLDFLMGELIGELNAGHTYVFPGESPRVNRVDTGTLGCDFVKDSGRYRISKIFGGRRWNASERSPLAQAGVDAKENDYLLEIDGHDVTTSDNPFRFLENRVGVQVTLLLNDKPEKEGAREVVVTPIASEVTLRYIDWVESNAAMVDELSDGRIGYVHVPNTAVPGHRALFEGFPPQARVKDAMIIDDRYNGGGFIPARMIASLASPVLNYWSQRETTLSATPATGFDGPMAMLINGYSSSGGDAFPFYFRRLGLGKLIGKTTWGGLIGYSGSPNMVDGGGLAVPSFSFVNLDGEWDVEAVGVDPDIEVFDDPTQIQAGRQPTLEAAVKHLLEELERNPPPVTPPTPAGPKRNK